MNCFLNILFTLLMIFPGYTCLYGSPKTSDIIPRYEESKIEEYIRDEYKVEGRLKITDSENVHGIFYVNLDDSTGARDGLAGYHNLLSVFDMNKVNTDFKTRNERLKFFLEGIVPYTFKYMALASADGDTATMVFDFSNLHTDKYQAARLQAILEDPKLFNHFGVHLMRKVLSDELLIRHFAATENGYIISGMNIGIKRFASNIDLSPGCDLRIQGAERLGSKSNDSALVLRQQ